MQAPLARLLKLVKKERRLPCPLKSLEKKVPFPCAPWYEPPEIRIAPTRSLSIEEHNALDEDPGVLCVYTDGSGAKKRVGSAAVIPSLGKVRRLHMDPLKDQNSVYGGELQGIRMALKLTDESRPPLKKIAVFTDNQAAIYSNFKP